MFELIRERKKFLLVVLLLLVIPPFVVVGAWDQFNPNREPVVATVDGVEIYKRNWENAHQNFIDNFRAQVGQNVPDELLNSDDVKKATLDNMINQVILRKVISEERITVSDEDVRAVILGIPQFQNDQGAFDLEKAKKALNRQGMTTVDFEKRLKGDLSLSLVPEILSSSSIIPRTVVRRLAQAQNETRTFGVKLFPLLKYRADAKVEEKEIRNFFDDNKDIYVMPATYDINFFVLNKDEKVEEISNVLYEQNSSLEPAAEKFSLKIQTISKLDLNAPAIFDDVETSSLKALNSPKFRQALFSKDFLEDNYNTELIEVEPNLFIAASLEKKHDEVPIEFDVVKDQISSELSSRKMTKLAKADAEKFRDDMSKNTSKLGSLKKVTIDYTSTENSKPDQYAQLLGNYKGQLFSHDLEKNTGNVFDLGSSGAAVVFFLSSKLDKLSDKKVIKSIENVFASIQQYESDLTVKAWMKSFEKDIEVIRYPKVLLINSAVE